MSKLTKKIIIDAVSKKFDVKPEYIELLKCEGEYYWGGKAGCSFSSTLAFSGLNAVSLERWIEDFGGKLEEWKNETLGDQTLNEYIESINWEVEFED